MNNKIVSKNGKRYRKYGLVGRFAGIDLYRLRYVDFNFGMDIYTRLKNQGYVLSCQTFEYKGSPVIELEVQCTCKQQINYIKTFSVKKQINKLQQKLIELEG